MWNTTYKNTKRFNISGSGGPIGVMPLPLLQNYIQRKISCCSVPHIAVSDPLMVSQQILCVLSPAIYWVNKEYIYVKRIGWQSLPEWIIRLPVSEDVAGDNLFSHYTSPFVAALGSVSGTLLTNTINIKSTTECLCKLSDTFLWLVSWSTTL